MNPWPGLSGDQLRELERMFIAAVFFAPRIEDLPADSWIDNQLSQYGCPDNQLDAWRRRVWRVLHATRGPGASRH